MAGWHLLLLLVFEVTLYGAVAHHANASWGWTWTAAISLAVGIYLWVRIVLVGLEFMLARWKGDPIPMQLRISSAQFVAMYLRELGGWLLMFSLVLPFVPVRRSVIDRPLLDASQTAPILLVHGLACNRGYWFWFRRQLELRGHQTFAIDYGPWYARIGVYSPRFASAIDEVLARTGARQVVVIAHSMGGLVARAYLDRFGGDKIVQVITLGTPHQGTWMTRFGFTPNVRDMGERSAWLSALRAREAKRSDQPYAKFTCVFSYHDNLVVPQKNATLPGAAQIAVSGLGHVSLALSWRVFAVVLSALNRHPQPA